MIKKYVFQKVAGVKALKALNKKNGGKMGKKIFIFIFLLSSLFLSGCLQNREHLTINLDGSGTLEVEDIIPSGTIAIIDTMMSGFVEMAEALGPGEAPSSIAEEMFANKDEIVKKAEAVGVNIDFLDFRTEKKNGDLHVNYTIKFDNVKKLIESDILSAQIELRRDFEENIILALKSDKQQEAEMEAQKGQLEGFLDSEQFQKLDSAKQKNILEAIKFLKFEFSVTMPNRITDIQGLEQKNQKIATFSFQGNILEDQDAVEKMVQAAAGGFVACSAAGVTFLTEGESVSVSSDDQDFSAIRVEESFAISQMRQDEDFTVGSFVRIYLSGGRTVEGKVLQKTDSYIKIEMQGISLTYYLDDVEYMEIK